MKNLIILGVLFLCLFCGTAFAGNDSSPSNINDKTGPSVGDFQTPDHRIDLEKIRQSGYQGSLDLEGYDVGIDPVTGEPIIHPQQAKSNMDHPDDIYWNNTLSSSILGTNGTVYAMTTYNGLLIIGGRFSVVGDIFANNIASWDGSSWDSLGSGMNSWV